MKKLSLLIMFFQFMNTVCFDNADSIYWKASLAVDYFQYKNIKTAVVISDWTQNDILTLTKKLWSRGIMVSHQSINPINNVTYSFKISDLFKQDYYRIGVFYDAEVLSGQRLMKMAEDRFMIETYSWLFFCEGNCYNYHDIFDALNLFIDADITLVNKSQNCTAQLYDLYNPGKSRGGLLNVSSIGEWGKDTGLIMNDHEDKYTKRRRDARGILIRAVSVTPRRGKTPLREHLMDRSKPYEDSFSKVSYDLILLLADFYNLTIELSETFSWSDPGVIGEFCRNQSDISATAVRLIIPRLPYIVNVYQIWEFSTSYIFLNPQYVGKISNTFMKPFSGAIWGTTAGAIILATVLLTVSYIYENKSSISTSYLLTPVLTVLGALSQQGTDIIPRKTSGRVVFLILFTLSMLLYNFYTSSVVSSLLSDKKSLINSIKDLADSNMKIGIEDIIYNKVVYEKEVTDELNYFLDKKTNHQPKMVKKFYMALEDGADQVQRGGFAFNAEITSMYEIMAKKYKPNQICRLHEVGVMPKLKLSVAVKKGLPFTDMFRIGALRIAECGLINRCVKIFRAKRPFCQAGVEPQAVGGAQVAPALLLLLLGAVISVLILMIEKAVHWNRTRHGLTA